MGRSQLNIMIGGEAGQGLNTINDILCKGLTRLGYRIVVTQDYMSRVRGGHNTFAIRVSTSNIQAPADQVDLLVALNQETVSLHASEMSKDHIVIADAKLDLPDGKGLKVPFHDLAKEKFQNVAHLGVLGSMLGLDRKTIGAAVHNYFGKKSEQIASENDKALAAGFDWADKNFGKDSFRLDKIEEPVKRLLMDGNQAIALGALSAGLKFYSFYPMTPSTGIGITLAAQMDKLPIVVEQAEDEIAAINMAIGASYAGAPAMTGTSGGGFALMAEGLSLAANSETPIVIAIAQRAAPATGLPTRTEQSDLEFALHAGHGEFPRAILAPGNVEQCFEAGRRALILAEKTQCPVIILTDQFQADSLRAIEPFNLDGLEPVRPGADPDTVKPPYKRYRITESGVSPRLVPGASDILVAGDSHAHDEDGHISEDAAIRTEMLAKSLRKIEALKAEVTPPEFIGEDGGELLLVCWGSTRGSAVEAARAMSEKGRKTSVLHFSQVWPILREQFMPKLVSAKLVVSVEQNAPRQLARLIRRETGFEIKKLISRFDGRPITPGYILRGLSDRRKGGGRGRG